jgi:hypothetical protein
MFERGVAKWERRESEMLKVRVLMCGGGGVGGGGRAGGSMWWGKGGSAMERDCMCTGGWGGGSRVAVTGTRDAQGECVQ